MKPYKILYPQQSLWRDTQTIIEVSIVEKKVIHLPLKLLMNCQSISRSKHIAEKVIIKHE